MPELPDVEIFRRFINSTSLHQQIKNINVIDDDLLNDISSQSFQIRLKGEKFKSTSRHGKYIFVSLLRKEQSYFHFGMTGSLKYYKNDEDKPKYSKIIFDFNNGFHLSYVCPRKLGNIGLVKSKEEFIKEKELVPDPLTNDFNWKKFNELFTDRLGNIKSALMNQKIIAGIGNVYSDEILFQAGIYPFTKIRNLSDGDLQNIFKQLKSVIKRIINTNLEKEKFPKTFLVTIRNDGEKCPKCGGTIKRKKYSNRSAYYCKKHQKKK